MRNLRLALFDLDDTLHDDTMSYMAAGRDVSAELSARLASSPEEITARFAAVLRAFWKGLTLEEMRRGVERMRTEMWLRTLRSFGVDDHDLAGELALRFEKRRMEYYRLYPGAIELLLALRERGWKTGLVSNGFAVTHRAKIGILGLEPYFDAIFLSDEVQYVKPDPRFFSYVCDHFGETPSASAMIGDRYDKDLVGAIELGIFTVWVNTHRKVLPSGCAMPDAIVDAISDVRSVLLGNQALR